jgi:phosphohistidine phosphatase
LKEFGFNKDIPFMAKDLFLIRHAKSDWSFSYKDFDRPLNARGHSDAAMMAERLQIYYPKALHLVSSPAKRALTTAQIFAEQRKMTHDQIQIEPSIYEANIPALLEIITAFPDHQEPFVMFGHNPGITDLINYLTDETLMDIPTCAWAHIHFDSAQSWAEISRGTGHLIKLATPRF